MSERGHDSTDAAAAKPRVPTILQVLPALVAGGVERGTVEIARALEAAGMRALVASAGGPMVHELERAGALHITLPLDLKGPLEILANARRLKRLIEAEEIDLVHARSRAPAWAAYRATRRTGTPFVTTYHSPYGDNWLKRPYNAVMAKGDKVIAISDFIADLVRGRHHVAEDKLVRIHRGVDLAVFDPEKVGGGRMAKLAQDWRLPDDKTIFMLPGRLTRWKGQLVLLDALRRLERRDFLCLLVGDDQGRARYRAEIEKRVRRDRLDDVVRLTGPCRDMAAAYMLADVVISASSEPEGFGRVAAEAQAMGKPVIATDHGGSREIVLAGETGWLVAPNDGEALAGALAEVLSLDTATREAVSYAARARIERHFTTAAMCAQTLAVYKELLTRGRGG